jgi:hypothetical protein
MSRLRDGTILTAWTRSIAAVHPELAGVSVDPSLAPDLEAIALGDAPSPAATEALGDHLVDGDPGLEDALLLGELRDLDRRYVGWLPGFWPTAEELIARVEKMHARRRMLVLPRAARPSLPGSVVQRAHILRQLGADTVYLDDDVDGLALLLATEAQVTLREPNAYRRAWIAREADLAGVSIDIVDEPPRGPFQLSVIHTGVPAQLAAVLSHAVTSTAQGGHIAVCVRAPWEDSFLELAELAGLSVTAYHREIDHWWLPSGSVVDGAGDLAILDRPAGARPPSIQDDPEERIRARPYMTVDLDDLPPSRLDTGAMERFATALAARTSRVEAMSSLQSDSDRDVLAWYDETGVGLTAELRRKQAHFMFTLMPYDIEMEYVALVAAYECLADRFTRARPLRTRRWQMEGIFG